MFPQAIIEETDIPPIMKLDPPPGPAENIDDQEDDLMGFGFNDDDIETTEAMSNAAAWNSLPVASSHEPEGSEVGKSWSEAAEERRNQQKIKSSMELHRVSQQVFALMIHGDLVRLN